MKRARNVTSGLGRRRRRVALAATAMALVAAVTASAAYADPQGEPPVVAFPTAVDPTLTSAAVRAQVDQADLLRRALLRSDARLAAASSAMQVLSLKTTAALERVRAARERETAARAEMLRQVRRLTALQGQVDDSQAGLGRWARESYTTGGPMASYETWITAFEGRSTDDVAHDLAVLEHVGLVGSQTLDRLEVATAAQQDAAKRAAAAANAAAAARASADAAKRVADRLLRQQREALADLQVQQIRTLGAVALTRQQLMSGGSAAGFVAEAQLAATLRTRAKGEPLELDPDDCTGLDTSSYTNGEIPTAALCPVWGAPGQLLRADAAAGFREVSRAFALQFGTPICVGDSYRTRAGQVAVFAAKPDLAAVPGTSNHGWGTAADLCGGIQSFATMEHAWLLVNAPLYGWFHPSWAGPAGSKPEPWHWEFAG